MYPKQSFAHTFWSSFMALRTYVSSASLLAVALFAGTALTSADAQAQPFTYTYYPSNATINAPVTTDFAIIGFSGGQYNPDTFAREFTGPSSPTVSIAAGADVLSAEVFNSSTVNMTGGTASVGAYDNSTVNIAGGSVPFALGVESSVINVYGGMLDYLGGQCQRVNVAGGTISTLEANVQTAASGTPIGVCTVDVTGGTITTEMNAFNGGILNLRGGQYLVPFAYAIDGSTIQVFGSNLVSQLIDSNFSTGSNSRYSVYAITGQLSDGTSLSNLELRIKNDGSSSFTLNNVPTPGAAGVLTMGGLLAARRRRIPRGC